MLTQEELKAQLYYDQATGVFKWLQSGKGRRADLVAGTVTNKGYYQITIKYKRYLSSHLAWLYMTGSLPVKEIDHENGKTRDNSWKNLQEVTHAQNLAKAKRRWDNTSGFRGVCWDKQKLKWKVQISFNNGRRLQKHFSTMEEAVAFYKLKATELFGEFAPDAGKPSDQAENDLPVVSSDH